MMPARVKAGKDLRAVYDESNRRKTYIKNRLLHSGIIFKIRKFMSKTVCYWVVMVNHLSVI